MEGYKSQMDNLSELINKAIEHPNNNTLVKIIEATKALYFYCKICKQFYIKEGGLMMASSFSCKASQIKCGWKNAVVCLKYVQNGNVGFAKQILQGDIKPTESDLLLINLKELDAEF